MKTKLLIFVLLLASISCHSCQTRPSTSVENTQPKPSPFASRDVPRPSLTSMIALIGDPTQFDGKQVQIMGFMHVELESTAIYLSREDYQYGLITNGIWLDIPRSDLTKYKDLNDGYVVVEGTFYGSAKGKLYGNYNTGIEKITMIRGWAKVGAKPLK